MDVRSGSREERTLVITRTFNAPRELVFRAWTDPQHLKRWWGPKDFTTPFCEVDLRPGGTWRYCMRSPEGQDYWCAGVYREIVPPERIVSSEHFTDAVGNRVPATHYGMDPDWPEEMVLTVTFAEEDGRTTVTVRQSMPLPMAERAGVVQGWNESLDRLDEHLARG